MTTKHPARKAGFTLIEVMLVVVIIGILAAVAVPKIGGNLKKAQVNATRGTIKTLDSSIDSFMLDHNAKLPNALQDLIPYIKNAKGVPQDAFGTAFSYTPNHTDGSYEIRSAGPDGVMGNEDDITN